jgi:hypothetical protein
MRSYPEYDSLTEKTLGCIYAVHSALGPGLLENTYKECLFYKRKMFCRKGEGHSIGV